MNSEKAPTDFPQEAGREKSPEVRRKVGVALSGGGHRATLFGLGALLYLAESGINKDVMLITSVSGGSLTNGYVAQSLDYRKCSASEFRLVAGKLAGQIALRGTLFAIWQAKAFLILLVLVGLSEFACVALLVWRPIGMPHISWVTGMGLILLFAFGRIWQLRGKLCEKAFADTLFSRNGIKTTLIDRPFPPPHHIICATEIQTGSGAYYVLLPDEDTTVKPPKTVWSPVLACDGFDTTPAPFTLAAAVRASAALPLAFPAVRLAAKGIVGITRRKVSKIWKGDPARQMLLVDGGVRDNLGVEWFDLTPDHMSRVIVVSGAANRVRAKGISVKFPLVGEMLSLMLVKDLPYNTREQNRRKDLLRRFLLAYEGQSTTEFSGVIAHIEESPYDLAEAMDSRSTTGSQAGNMWAFIDEDRSIVQAVEKNPQRNDFKLRAKAVMQKLITSEDVPALRKNRIERTQAAGGSDEFVKTIANMTDETIVFKEWEDRVFRNANIRTSLRRLGKRRAAELMRHSFALTMAKAHILFDYPVCNIPSIEDLEGTME